MRRLLSGARGLEVLGEAATWLDAIALCHRLQPDLVLMDVRRTDIVGLAATRAIRDGAPRTRVLVCTMYEASDHVAEAMRAGAAGYLLKVHQPKRVAREIVPSPPEKLRGKVADIREVADFPPGKRFTI